VVEDRPAGQAGALLKQPHGGAFVAVAGEAGPGTVEDLLPAGGTVVGADPGHVTTLRRVLQIDAAAEQGGDPQVE
jgi:hypothetical protein